MTRASEDAARALGQRVAGRVLARGSARYERVRSGLVWNGRVPERRPELVVRVASSADVAEVVRFARERHLQVSVRSGGHSWCGAPLRDGGILLDLGDLAAIDVDPDACRVSAGPAASNAALARALSAHGLAFPYGHCPPVALGGYLLAGGLGWNGRVWGLAAHNLEAVEVVLADGRQVTADARRHPDLLWAARGAGPGFFAVATRLRLRAHPLPAAIATASSIFRARDAALVAAWIETLVATLPARVELTLFLAPAALFLPGGDGRRRILVVAATTFANDPAQAAQDLAFLAGCPLRRRVLEHRAAVATSFDELFAGTSALYREGLRYVADTAWCDAFAGAMPVLATALERAPVENSFFLCAVAPLARRARVAAPSVSRGSLLVNCYAAWADAGDDGAGVSWCRRAMDALAPLTTGRYVGESDVAVPGRARGSFSPSSWRKIERLRRRYDPEGLFHPWLDGS